MKRLALYLLRDPVVHFLVLAGLVFGAYRFVHGPTPGTDAKTIVVDRAALLRYMQYQAAAFEPKFFGQQLDAMSPREKRDLVDRYVREEALFREAGAMGLADGDYVIRRRVVQKIRYLLDDAATERFAPDDAELERYFLAHRERYEIAPSLTFTHVFVDAERKRDEPAEQAAEALKARLQSEGAAFDEAPRYGDRFPYLQNYVGRTPDFVASEFGPEFAAALMALEPSDRIWRGPFESPYGYHLVMLTDREAERLPELAEVRPQVEDDLLRETRERFVNEAIGDLVADYRVELDGVSIDSVQDSATDDEHLASSVR